ncbi:hypothetical protein ACK387_19485 [Aeromonas veronii]
MARIIICKLCHLHVEEGKLLVHLLDKHQWVEVKETPHLGLNSMTKDPVSLNQPVTSLAQDQLIAKPVATVMKPCSCIYCKVKVEPAHAIEHMRQCQKRINQLANKEKQGKPEQGRVLCAYCNCKVHARNIMSHIRQRHLSEQASSAIEQQGRPGKQAKRSKQPKVVMTSKRGTLTVGLRICDKCRVNHMENWTYQFSDGTSKTVCRFCKGQLLDNAANRRVDVMDRCVPGSAMSGKRR